ncbi:MAG: phosphodiester glycosidase family protein, partial [Chloroflexota bacterium]
MFDSFLKHRWLIVLSAIAASIVLGCGMVYALIVLRPDIGAQGADSLRQVVGQQAVAQLETTVYDAQDTLYQWLAQLGLKRAESPWVVAQVPMVAAAATATAEPLPMATTTTRPAPTSTSQPKATATATVTPSPTWQPNPILPFTTMAGEGQWQPYLQDGSGRTIAFRAFAAPDAQRPYVMVGIVAFDLRATQLHFVLGSEEPKSSVAVERTGRIPTADEHAGKLLTVFNGGFKADHGQYGAMVNNVIVLPPRRGHMTVAIAADGTVRMGAWGVDDITSPSTTAWRQNGPAIIQRGQINPLTEEMTAANWGANIDGSVAVWRSALAQSQDGRVLYYAAGDSLIVATLARALLAASAYQAMQLDINNYWVYFGAVKWDGARLNSEPLFDKMKNHDTRRYLNGYSRDFFYVTAREPLALP